MTAEIYERERIPHARMRELEVRCVEFFGGAIKSAVAQWTPNSTCGEIAVALEKWDGTTRVVPEPELERVMSE